MLNQLSISLFALLISPSLSQDEKLVYPCVRQSQVIEQIPVSVSENSPDACKAECLKQGFQFAFLTGDSCRCGNDPRENCKVDVKFCDEKCPNSNFTCGGKDDKYEGVDIFYLTVVPTNHPCSSSKTCLFGDCIGLKSDTAGEGKFGCICRHSVEGDNCDLINCTVFNPCKFGSRCESPPDGKYKCHCVSGGIYEGIHCDEKIDFCDGQSCPNEGECVSDHGKKQCACKENFAGGNCGINTQEACNAMRPCRNGGTCQPADKWPWFQCQCMTGFGGDFCEQVTANSSYTLCFKFECDTKDEKKSCVEDRSRSAPDYCLTGPGEYCKVSMEMPKKKDPNDTGNGDGEDPKPEGGPKDKVKFKVGCAAECSKGTTQDSQTADYKEKTLLCCQSERCNFDHLPL